MDCSLGRGDGLVPVACASEICGHGDVAGDLQSIDADGFGASGGGAEVGVQEDHVGAGAGHQPSEGPELQVGLRFGSQEARGKNRRHRRQARVRVEAGAIEDAVALGAHGGEPGEIDRTRGRRRHARAQLGVRLDQRGGGLGRQSR